MDSLVDTITNIPPVTRFFTICTFAVWLSVSFEILLLRWFLVDLYDIIGEYRIVKDAILTQLAFNSALVFMGGLLQSYRFFVVFLIPQGMLYDPMAALLTVYLFYNFANKLEGYDGKFHRNFPDCLWFTLVTGTMIVISFLVCDFLKVTYGWFDRYIYNHHYAMMACLQYIWSRHLKNVYINFMLFFNIKGYYFPLFMLGISLIVKSLSSFYDYLVGVAVGYIYLCIQSGTIPIYNLLPTAYGPRMPPGQKVGQLNQKSMSSDYIGDAVFDKGYLKAPIKLYKWLGYPTHTSKRLTYASESRRRDPNKREEKPEAAASGSFWSADSNNPFTGRGNRLGD